MRAGSRFREFTVGTFAAGMPLAVGEFAASLADRLRSPVVAIGDLIIDLAPGSVVRVSISTFGMAQKPLILTGIVAVVLVLGGLSATLTPRTLPVILVASGTLGGWAMARSPLTSAGASWMLALLLVGTGLAVLHVLRGRSDGDTSSPDAVGTQLEDPRIKYADRRSFLAYAGGMSATAVALVGAGRVVTNRSAQEARARVRLPTTSTTPTTTEAPLSKLPDIEGLSPWITPNPDFYRVDTALTVPVIEPTDWSLMIHGLTKREMSLSFDDLLAMDVVDATVTLACVSNEVGGPLIGNAVWTGVLLSDVLALAEPLPVAEQVMAWSVDGFSAGFPLDTALDGRRALVAFGMNGEPLPLEHGFPVRLVIPGLYGYVSAVKWLFRLDLTRWEDGKGFWIDKGWSRDAPIKISSRIDVPAQRRVDAGSVPIAGVAWYPDVGVAAVEVSIDSGPWQPCRIGESGAPGYEAPGQEGEAWVQWLFLWEATPGRFGIRVRAIGADGTVQSGTHVFPAPNGAEGYHEISVTVT